MTFYVARRALCSSLSSGKDIVQVVSCFDAVDADPEVNNYNISGSSLSITSPAAISSAYIGMEFTRTSTVYNGGLGATDTVHFYVVYPDGELESTSLTQAITANSVSFDPVRVAGDTLFYKIADPTLFGGNNILENSESVTITESLVVAKCTTSPNAAKYSVYNGVNTSSSFI